MLISPRLRTRAAHTRPREDRHRSIPCHSSLPPSGPLPFVFVFTFHNSLPGLGRLHSKSPAHLAAPLSAPCLLHLPHGLLPRLRLLRPPKVVHPLRLPPSYQPGMRGRCQGLGAMVTERSQVQRLETGGVLWAQGRRAGRVVFPPRPSLSPARVLRRRQLSI